LVETPSPTIGEVPLPHERDGDGRRHPTHLLVGVFKYFITSFNVIAV